MLRRAIGAGLILLTAAAAAQALEERLRYDFDEKKSGGKAIPHAILAGEVKDFDNPAAPKGKEIDDAAYQRMTNPDDKFAGVDTRSENGRAAFLIVFVIEKAVQKAAGAWKSLELDLHATAGAPGRESGVAVVLEAYAAAEKQWVPLENSLKEEWRHLFALTAPYAAWPDRDGRIAFRVSAQDPQGANRVALDYARLTLKVESGDPKDPLTLTSLGGECRITRPDDPQWGFADSDDWAILLRKGDKGELTLRVKRWDGRKKYKFSDKMTLPGDVTKGIAEAVLAAQMEAFSTREKVEIVKGQLGPYQTLEWSFVGEVKKSKTLRAVREIFIKEKQYTYRINVIGYSEWMKKDRADVDGALKTFRIAAE